MLDTILSIVAGIVTIATFILARVQENQTVQQGRDEVKAANTEKNLDALKKSEAIDRDVDATPLSDLQQRMSKYRRD